MKTLLGMSVGGSVLATARVVAVMAASAIVVMAIIGIGALEARGDLLVPGRRPPLPRPQPSPERPPEAEAPLEATGIRAPVRVLRGPDNLPRQVEYRIMIPRKVLENLLKSEEGVIVPPSNGTVESEPRGGAPFLGTVIAAVLLAAAIAIAPFAWRRRQPIGKRGWVAGVAGSLLLAVALAGLVAYFSGGTRALADIALPPGQRQQLIQLEVTDAGNRVTLFTR
jgi:hypothetical protein